jgi:uncharacterized protein (TIGR00251 family)
MDQATPAQITLTCRVTPNAKRSEVTGWSTDERGRPICLIKLSAPPVDGKANAELQRFLAEKLQCPKSQITLLRGNTSRLKSILIPAAAASRLQ